MAKLQGSGGSYASQLAARKNAAEDYHSGGSKKSGGGKAGAVIATILMGIVAYGILTADGDLNPKQIGILCVGAVWVMWLWGKD